jgi:competence protein ComEC
VGQRLPLADQPLAWAAAALMLGVWAWPWIMPGWLECALGACLLTMIGSHYRFQRIGQVAAFLAALVLGLLVISLQKEPSSSLPSHARGQVIDRIGVHALVDTREGRLLLRFAGEGPAVGTEIAAWIEPETLRPTLPGAWSVEGIMLRSRASSGRARDWLPIGSVPQSSLGLPPSRHEGLLSGLLLGDTSGVDPAEEALLKRTGTRHLMAVSGLHMGIVAGLAWLLIGGLVRLLSWTGGEHSWRLPRLIGGVAAVAATCLYASVVGWPVSARRALYMITATSIALCLGRRPAGWSLLGLAAIVVLLRMPYQVTRPGFLLSFGAVAGIIGISPAFSRWISPDLSRPTRWALHSLCVSLGASLGTLPVSAWVFQDWSLVGPLANLFAGPLVSICIVPAALGACILPPGLAELSLGLAERGLDLLIGLLRLMDAPLWHPAVGPLGAVGIGLALCCLRRPVLCLALAGASLELRPRVYGELVLSFLAVGQGDSALVQWPDGRHWLVDGGPPSTQVLHWLRREGLEQLDLVVLSHPDLDHLGGLLPVLEQIEVSELWLSRDPGPQEESFLALVRSAQAQGTRVRTRSEIDDMRLLPAPENCSSDNECGLVLELRHGQRAVLLTGDIGIRTEKSLLSCLGPVDVLKVGHHGSNYSSDLEFLDHIAPELSVISVGARNAYGHPGSGALGRLDPSRVLRTDRDGSIRVQTDGKSLNWRSLP